MAGTEHRERGTSRHTLPRPQCNADGLPNSGIQPEKISGERTKTTRRFQCHKDLLTSRHHNFSNSYTINVQDKIAIARSLFLRRKISLDSTLLLCIIILALVLGIVSIAKADLKPREWGVDQEWKPKEHRSIKVPGEAKKLTLDEYRMALAEKNAVIIYQQYDSIK